MKHVGTSSELDTKLQLYLGHHFRNVLFKIKLYIA